MPNSSQMSTDSVQGDRTLQMFFLQQGQPSGTPGGFSALSLRAKASALYGAATHVSTNLGLRRTDPTSTSGTGNPAQDFQNVETTIARFVSTLLPIHQLGAGLPDEDRRSYVVTHTLAHAAYIQLHLRFAREGDVPSIEKCVRSARGAAQLVRHLVDSDYDYLDPTFGVSIERSRFRSCKCAHSSRSEQACWSVVASVFGLEKVRAAVSWQSQQTGKPQQQPELDLIVLAMTRLSSRFPIMGAF